MSTEICIAVPFFVTGKLILSFYMEEKGEGGRLLNSVGVRVSSIRKNTMLMFFDLVCLQTIKICVLVNVLECFS